MSTYTDLHNRIKENLTILRKPGSKDDGMSPQKVILINPENQFYGTFNGKMNITSGILSGLKIIDSELEGVKLDDVSVDGVPLRELKTTVDVNTQDIEQLQKDAKAISAAHDALSVGLSGAVDNLSVAVNEKLDNAVDEVKKSISGVVSDVTTLSIGLGDLSSKVETLSSGMLNGVVYKGQLVLHRDYYTRPRQLFNDDPACCLLEGTQTPLKNGWMWRVSLDRENISGDYVHVSDPNTGRELDLGKGDYIIIKNHLTSLYEVVPDDQMRMDDFDVINAQDEDDTKIAVLKQVSAYLDNKIDESLVSAKDYTDEVSAGLNALFNGKLSSVSAYALAESIKYTNGVSSEICSTVNTKLITLSNDLSSYSNKLCSDLSTQVDAEYVHRAGDTIAKLSVVGELDIGGKTTINHDFGEAGGTKLELSKDKVELKSFAPLSISSTNDSTIAGHNIAFNAHNLSINLEDGIDDLFIGDRTIKEVLSDTYLISDDISYRYDKSENALKLGVRGHELSVDVAELFDKKIIKDVRVVKRESGTYIAITFDVDGDPSTSEDEKTIEIKIDDFFKLYTSGYGISIDNQLNISIAKSFDDQVQAIQGYVNELSGPVGPYIGIIPSLSNEISSLRQDEKFEVQFKNLPIDAEAFNERYESIGEFLSAQLQPYDYNWIRNNTEYLIQFLSGDGGVPLSARISINDSLRTSIGNGDMILVHVVDDTASGPSKVNFSDIIAYDRSKKTGNTFIIKAGVSRYEFEAEVKKRTDDDNFLSTAIDSKIFIDEISAESLCAIHISQDDYCQRVKDGQISSNVLYVVSSDYINAYGEQLKNLAAPTEPSDATTKEYVDDISSSLNSQIQQLSSDLSNEISSLEDKVLSNDAYLSTATDNKIFIDGLSVETLSAQHISRDDYYNLVSSDSTISNVLYVVSSDNINAYGQQLKNLAAPTDLSDAATKEYVDVNNSNLSTAIDSKIFIDEISAESLCAIHISQQEYYDLVSSDSTISNVLYVVSSENINAYGQQIKNLAAPELSGDAATKGYVDGISSSLNSQIQKLSDDLSSEIETLSTNLSTSISTLTSQMELALSALDKDPLSSLNADSKISTVIDAVLDIRDTLSALRSILRI